jgi:cephalosporin hydroxylase
MSSNDILDIIIKNNINGFECHGGTDKASCHSYDEIYSRLLSKYKDTSGTILEIGVQYGGSALLWYEYLPKFNLVLLDNVDIVHPSIWERLSKERYEFITRDAFTKDTIDSLNQKYPEGFDIIVEDGPHDIITQTFTITEYSKLLKSGGTLIIEDIQDYSYIDTLMTSVKEGDYSTLEFYDLRDIKGRYDDLIIVLTK